MPRMLKDFSGVLVGVVLVKAVDYFLAPANFDLAEETLETFVLAVVLTFALSLYKKWRRRKKRSQ